MTAIAKMNISTQAAWVISIASLLPGFAGRPTTDK
jgi:hypothetical protein